MIIYKITNLLNNKQYIGQTKKTIQKRWKEHINSKKRQALHLAIQKYGIKNFKIEQIAIAQNQEELNQLEFDLINKHNTMAPSGYNLRSGGMQCGISEETRQKKLDWYKTHKNPQLGKKLTEEHKRKISEANKNRVVSETTRKKISMSQKGKIISQRQREIVSISNKTRKITEETRVRLRISHIGKASEWAKGNTNVKGRSYYHNPETNVVIMLKPDTKIPHGFVKGRGFCSNKLDINTEIYKLNRETMKHRKWYHNPITMLNKRLLPTDNIPDGFIPGRFKCCSK